MRDFTCPSFMDDPTANPFLDDLFVDLPTNLPGVGRIHQAVFTQVVDAVESILPSGEDRNVSPGLGRTFLVTAPEAGYGKSHLVARLRDHLGAIASTLFLPFDRSRPASWPVALSSVLRQFSTQSRSRQPVVSLLEETSRHFVSRLILNGIASGAVKPRDCPEDPSRVKEEFATLFARESDSRLLAWVDKRAAELVRGADPGFSRRLGMGAAELAFWTRLFVDLNLREEGALDRLRGLSNGEARERLLQLLRISTDHQPVMLVADGLDGFHHSETAGMEIAEIANGIRERVPRSVTLLCVNDDVWSSVFEGRLPTAWRDRLDGEVLRLHSLGAEAAKELVKFRLRRTRLVEVAAAGFARQLAETHHWSDGETPLSPRRILRQAGEMWRREARNYLAAPAGDEEDEFAAIAEAPLANLTDKASFFEALQRESEPPAARAVGPELPPPLPAPECHAPASPPTPQPVPMKPPRSFESDLAGIDSIINDIRGSGKTVVSEAPESRFDAGADPNLPPRGPVSEAMSNPDFTAAPAGSPGESGTTLAKSPPLRESNAAPVSFFAGFSPPPTRQSAVSPKSAPLTRASLEQDLARREREFLAGPGLALDLERIARFIRIIGAKHPGLAQQEERYPSSRTVCLRWNARGHSVLTGFESPRNVYFWNNLLQQSLASNRHEKIAAFSHPSEAFDPSLFASFGFSPAVIRGRIDIVEMNDRELAMIYAADLTLQEYQDSPDAEKAIQFITLHLDPLWRRMIQPL